MSTNIKTWQERAEAELGYHYAKFKSDRYMLAEIADLRAALALAQAPSASVAPDERDTVVREYAKWMNESSTYPHNSDKRHPYDAFKAGYVSAALSVKAARPELTVWYGAMPESNGKSNFTAVLMRKGEGWDGPHVTIERGEYPERIRYEADRVRHLIGEIADAPFILDYDADKHSGYIAPTPPTTGEA